MSDKRQKTLDQNAASAATRARVDILRAFFQFLSTVVERFGWPGLVLMFAGYFVEKHASLEQKRKMIDMYILGQGISSQWPIICLSLLFVIVLSAQQIIHTRKLEKTNDRVNELAAEKNRLQEELVGKRLRHGQDFKTREG